MNIAFHTAHRINPMIGGVERTTDNLAASLSERHGVGCYYFFFRGETDSSHIRLPEGSKEQMAACINQKCSELGITAIIVQDGLTSDLYTHRYIDRRVKLIHCLHTNVRERAIFRRLMGSVGKVPLRSTLVNLAFLANTPRRRLRDTRRWIDISRQVDHVVVLDPGFMAQMPAGIDRSRLVAIPNGIPETADAPSPETLLQSKERILLFVGRLIHNPKNIFLLCDLWQRLHQEFADWHMVLCGDGEDRAALERQARRLSLPRFEILGYTDPTDLYRQAPLLLLPSFSEGLSMVMIEGLRYGCVPMVYDASPSFGSICRLDGDQARPCGCIVDAYDKKAYVEACRRLMRDPAQLRLMQERAMANARNFSIGRVSDQWIDLLGR